MNKYELKHAKRYAHENTKLFVIDYYKKKFPHLFENVIVETRPATSQDYYVPPSLVNTGIVVTKTAFDEIGCKRLACFPFQEDLDPCEDNPPTWILIGNQYHLACQPSCKEQRDNIDTVWKDGKCILANPLKKLFALNPEQIFDNSTRGHLHSGLNINNNKLELNSRYCAVYGLEYEDGDCVQYFGQKALEYAIGRSLTRYALSQNLPPRTTQKMPTKIPDYLNYKVPSRRTKRSIVDEEIPDQSIELMKEIAIDLTKDIIIDISTSTVQHILKKNVPKLLSKITIKNIGIKVALTELVKRTAILSLTKLTIALSSVVGVVASIYTIFDILTDILDAIDIFDFNKVLHKSTIKEIGDVLDYKYYGEFGTDLTPETIWEREMLEIEDESEIIEFIADKINEYIEAIRPIKVVLPNLEEKKLKDSFKWKNVIIVVFIICVMIMFIEWIHIAGVIVLFLAIFNKNFTQDLFLNIIK